GSARLPEEARHPGGGIQVADRRVARRPWRPRVGSGTQRQPSRKAFQKAMFEQAIPLAAFETSDLKAEFARLKALGVTFTQGPTKRGTVTIAVLSDTCGNLLQLYQPG